MTSILRSTAAAALAALTLGAAVAGAPSSASAHERGFPVVAGILGGLAAGALIAGAAEAHPVYEYAPAAPAYVPAPVYAPAPVYDEDAYEAPVQVRYQRECWRQPVRQWGPWHEFIGWREVKVCR